jgi:hypothetical protein
MTAFLSLVGGVKGIIAILIIGALGLWAYNLKSTATKAVLERDQAITQRDAIATERDKAITAARANAETVTKLEQEKSDVNLALNTLAAAQQVNSQNAITREVIIQNQSSVAANSAKAAPVLGVIVKEIQNDRVRRRAQ